MSPGIAACSTSSETEWRLLSTHVEDQNGKKQGRPMASASHTLIQSREERKESSSAMYQHKHKHDHDSS